MRLEENAHFISAARKVGSAVAVLQIRAQKGRTHPAMPEFRARFEPGRVFGTNDAARGLPEDHRVRRVMERTEHTGHVPKRAALDAALAQWTQRFPFEI